MNEYSGSKYKSFKNLKEAQDFVSVRASSSQRTESSVPLHGESVNEPDKRKPPPAAVAASFETQLQSARPQKRPRNETKDQPVSRRKRVNASQHDVRVSIMFDGGARGNPGVAGAGAMVRILDLRQDFCRTLHVREFVGLNSTNNEAEYRGIISGLSVALGQLDARFHDCNAELIVQGDSNLVIKQLNGEYKVRKQNLKPLFEQTKSLLKSIESQQKQCTVALEHVYRSENHVADSK